MSACPEGLPGSVGSSAGCLSAFQGSVLSLALVGLALSKTVIDVDVDHPAEVSLSGCPSARCLIFFFTSGTARTCRSSFVF